MEFLTGIGSRPPINRDVRHSPNSPATFCADETAADARIMVVDDDPITIRVLRKHLTDSGFRHFSTTTESGEAIELFRTCQPDILLLDIRMPGTTGLEILQSIRQFDGLRVPILVLTSTSDDQTKIKALGLGASDYLTKPVDARELVTRVRNALIVKSHHDELARYATRLERAALIDTVTELANRRAFENQMDCRFADWARSSQPFSLVMCDIDHFKRVNDSLGHPAGDQLLRDVASRLLASVRKNDFVARFGGEEFVVILQHARIDAAAIVAETIRQSIAEASFRFEATETKISISLGVAEITADDSIELLVQRADEALYVAKASGRNCCYVHNGAECVRFQGATRQDTRQTAAVFDGKSGLPVDDKLHDRKILIVDDEEINTLIVKKYLKDAGYHNFFVTTDSTTAVELIESLSPDVILLDIHMPHVDGLQILSAVRAEARLQHLPVLILTSAKDRETKHKALHAGANDFLTKPIDAGELVARVRNSLILKTQHDELASYSQRLEREVKTQTSEIAASHMEAIQCLARAAECRDDHTGAHVIRVGKYAAVVAAELGIDPEFVNLLECAAQLHDVGKIGIPDSILRKPGRLTDSEFDVMRGHTTLGLQILADCRSPMMRLAASIAHAHHEKWNGGGYPNGLKGKQIPVEARITSLADVFDALSSARSYKDAISLDTCFDIIVAERGAHFDPDVVDAFLRRRSDIISIYSAFTESPVDPKRSVPRADRRRSTAAAPTLPVSSPL